MWVNDGLNPESNNNTNNKKKQNTFQFKWTDLFNSDVILLFEVKKKFNVNGDFIVAMKEWNWRQTITPPPQKKTESTTEISAV